MNAPSIAGLPRWYVTDQLRKFRREERGSHECDASGTLMQMKAMTLDERDLVFVAKFIESMEPSGGRKTMDMPSVGGIAKSYLSDCASCHGEMGEGNRAERAPPLTRQPDWYLLKQLANFREGKRPHTDDEARISLSEDEARAMVAWIMEISDDRLARAAEAKVVSAVD